MSKIAYLFGAGASKHALPIVYEIPSRIKELIEFLEKDEFKLDSNSKFTGTQLPTDLLKFKSEHQIDLINTLKWMLERSANHASVDTFAKKLYIKENFDDLRKLKIAMSIFFTFEQARKPADPRYDSFYASLLDRRKQLPSSVRIISWNYDYQFEMAFSEYSDQNEIPPNQDMLQVIAKGGYANDANFRICKLNGSCELYSKVDLGKYMYARNLKVRVDKDFIEQVTMNFVAATHSQLVYSALSFAWESEPSDRVGIVDLATNNISDCTTLVVIGYSFPFFNRDIDKKIINSMKSLKTVYFQAPDANTLKERFESLRDNTAGLQLVPKFDVGQFLLPNEL